MTHSRAVVRARFDTGRVYSAEELRIFTRAWQRSLHRLLNGVGGRSVPDGQNPVAFGLRGKPGPLEAPGDFHGDIALLVKLLGVPV